MWASILSPVAAVLLAFTAVTTYALPASENLQGVNTSTALALTNAYDPYASYKGVATVEVWIGSNRVNVGNMVGEELHNNLVAILASLCPWNPETFRCADWPDVINLPVKDVSFQYSPLECTYHGRCAHGSSVRVVSASFPTDTIRKLLIETAASAYSAMSKRIGNCYGGHTVSREGLMCSVSDQLKVNTPGGYMHLQLGPVNYDSNGHFHCCEVRLREWVDKEMDKLKPEWMVVHPLPRAKYRDVMCQVETCEPPPEPV